MHNKPKACVPLLACPAVLIATLVLLGTACRDEAPMLGTGTTGPLQPGYEDELFEYAIRNLNRLDRFNSGEMLQQITERLDQWIAEQPPLKDWEPDPLLKTLPEQLANLTSIEELDQLDLPPHDGAVLQQAVWLRDISAWARGKRIDPLSQARHLFDWTVRNIQLEPPLSAGDASPRRMARLPWETLLLGEGTAIERSWVYVLLLRQQGIDAALLGLPQGSADDDGPTAAVWAVGVLIDGEVYLFDLDLGLPVPAPDGVTLAPDGGLDIRPATLAEAAADDAVLRRLDLDADSPYPVRAAELNEVTALIAASPAELSQRMALLESYLVGEQRMVLSIDASAQAERFTATDHVTDARLWPYPFAIVAEQRTIDNPEIVRQKIMALAPFQIGANQPLWKGRLLHFQGKLVGERSATHFYQQARPSNDQLDQLAEHYFQALRQANPEAGEMELREMAQQRARIEHPLYVRAKQDASYWLGLVNYERDVLEAAVDYFEKRVLGAWPDGPWTHGARYNLGRTYAAMGEPRLAIDQFISDPLSPARNGNVLRARWLSELTAEEPADEPPTEPDASEPSAEPPEPLVPATPERGE